jgi:hypothetical protein
MDSDIPKTLKDISPASPGATAPAGSWGISGRNVRVTIVSLLLVIGFSWLLAAGGLPLLPPPGTLERLDLACFLGFVGATLFHLLTKYGRFQFLVAPLARVPLSRVMIINAVAMAFITLLPLRLGELARPAMLRKKGHLSAWAVTGTVAAERIIDGLLFSTMLLVGLWFAAPQASLPDRVGDLPVPAALVPQAGRVAALVFGLAFVIIAGFYWNRALARRATEKTIGLVSARLGSRVADIVQRLSDGLRFLVNPRYTLPFLGVTAVSIAAQVWSIELLANAVGLSELTFGQSAVVLGLVSIGYTLPNAPGFFGTVQLALYAGLAVYVAPERVAREGGALVFLFYTVHLGSILVLAAIGMALDFSLRDESPVGPSDEDENPA